MRLIRRIHHLIRNRRNERELAEEIEFHRQMIEERELHGGVSERDAAWAARRQMGSETLAREDARSVWVATWVQSAFQDLRYAVRSLRRQPSFTAFALLAIALGTGVNASLFTVYNAIALRTWPVRDPGSVVRFMSNGSMAFSLPEYEFLSAHSRAFQGLALEMNTIVNLDAADEPNSGVEFVTGDYFGLLGVRMALGRAFAAGDDRWERPEAVAVLSYRVWRARYGGDPGILGRQVRLNHVPFTVIGVVNKDFTGTSGNYDLWAPFASLPAVSPGARTELANGRRWGFIVGRLAPGVSREQARAEAVGLEREFLSSIGKPPRDITLRGSTILDGGNDQKTFYVVLLVLASACGAVLLVACANVANLLLARGAARRHEFAVRISIGAGRARIVRQLLTESLLLAVLGSGLGLPLACWLPGVVMGQLTAADLRPDLNVLGVMIALAVISTLLLGLAPAVRATGAGMYESMKQGRSSSPRFPLRSLLLGGQAAISVTLLVGAALLVRGLSLARSLDRGFKIDGVTAITAQLPSAAYNEERRRAFYDDIVEAMKPYGAVGFGTSPLGVFKLPFTLTDEKTAEARLEGRVVANGGYFDVLGIAIAAGRNFIPSDRQAHKIIVNEAMARRYWLGQSPIGKAIFFGGERLEIVGMARDCRFTGFGGDIEPAYFSHSDSFGVLLVPASLASIASSVARQLEPRVKLTASPLSVTLERLIAPAKRATLVAGMLGALALLLATVGVFGVMSYSVEQRRREIGIRMALGASRVEVLKSAFRYHIRPLVLGSAVGLAASLAASKVLVSLLYGLNRIDALAYGGAVAVMLAAGAAATVMPALRACRIDAAETLRYD